jgi:endonuclease G
MNEFRLPTHNKRYDRKSVGKLAFMVFFLVGVIFLFMYYLNQFEKAESLSASDELRYRPDPKNGVVYQKPNFSLSYVEQYELPEWVSYELTVDMMNAPKLKRDQDFNPDPAITTGSGHYHDYKSSGYRRGHLVPSGDMAWNKASMDATFLLSNVVPMLESFNDGIWLELENNIRDWSRKHRKIEVIAGPVFTDPLDTIGKNEILVPRYFYKAVFTIDGGKPGVIGFILEQNLDAYVSLSEYIVSIDSIEKITGLDLFANLYGNWDEEIRLEKQANKNSVAWPFNDRWYQQRIEQAERN